MAIVCISSRKGQILFLRGHSMHHLSTACFLPMCLLRAAQEWGEELSKDIAPLSQPLSFFTPIHELHAAAGKPVASHLSCVPLSKVSFLKCSFE